ncbi:MAG: hypothetical protein RMK84_06210 [Oscillochloridaceae bacterium]|nr:hypothetical protein [Chloroflexaceae bacterium]MDW8389700.1 hypothetical protein [Oscillochloridaceae bacterium]
MAARRARRLRRLAFRCAWLALLLIALAVPPPATPSAGASRQNRAGLIVQTGDGEAITRCVSFEEPQISGLALLERSGVPFAVVNDERYGAFICGIAGVGCPAERCLCAYPPRYWQYWLLERNGWRVSPVGASGRVVRDGDVDGWVWLREADGPRFDERFGNPCQTTTNWRVYVPLVR